MPMRICGRKSLCGAAVCWFILTTALAPAYAAEYYIDAASGSDSNPGTSPEKAWKSLDPANTATFRPGDQILLKAGTRYSGQLAPKGSGKAGSPITLGKYGDGPLPRIDGEGILDTLLIRNVDYWDICDLEITNKGETTQP